MTEPDDMACRELVELITDYLEGTLAAHDRDRFEAHLAQCEGCTQVLEQFRSTISLAGSLDDDRLSEEEREALLAIFRSWRDAAV